MKTVAKIFTIFSLWASLVFPLRANAVVFSPIPAEREENAVKGIMEKGDIVCLFQSGTADVRKGITVNDVLPVYRETKSHELLEVGKVKVLSYVGADYIKGEVIEGELKAGDIAKKGDVASLIISSGDKCN